MATKKGFTYVVPGDPTPWGAVESAHHEEVIDTLVGDSIQDAKDTLGHKHQTIYGDITGISTVKANSDGSVTIVTDNNTIVTVDTDGTVVVGNPPANLAPWINLLCQGLTLDPNKVIGSIKSNAVVVGDPLVPKDGGITISGESADYVCESTPAVVVDAFVNSLNVDDSAMIINARKSGAVLDNDEVMLKLTNEYTLALKVLGDGTIVSRSTSHPWVDYSSSSTLTGWSGTPYKKIKYRNILGNMYLCRVSINGTSDSINTRFTLPFNLDYDANECLGLASCFTSVTGYGALTRSGTGINVISVDFNSLDENWTPTGIKIVTGVFPFFGIPL
jgi:hypothetical protein